MTSSLKTVLKQGGWSLLAPRNQVQYLTDIRDIAALILQLENLPKTLKDNHRSQVYSGELLGRLIVAKRPIDKNRRKWARLSSLLRVAEAVATVGNLSRFEAAGIESVKPLFALEQRRLGMVVDSWVCYEYRNGEPCGAACVEKIVEMLHAMHSAGFQHGDPHWNNFLRDDSGQLFVIDSKGRSRRGTYSDTVDFALYKRINKIKGAKVHEIGNIDRSSPGYWLAMLYMSLKTGRSKLRDAIRRNRPKNRHG